MQKAVGMGSDVKSYDENLVGRRVKFWWPKDKSFCEGVVSSHDHSGKNLVVCANGVEEFLNLKRDNREPGAEEKKGPFRSPSHTISEGEKLIGCRVKVWRPKTKIYSEGVVASYNISHKKHVVAYANGTTEMMNLRKHREPADDVSPDQAQNEHAKKACDPFSVSENLKKPKRENDFEPMGSKSSGDNKKPKLENEFESMGSKSSDVSDNLVKINGYKVKTTSAPVLEAIFLKYGDIMANCVCKSTSVRASLLEVICNIVQRLQYLDVEAILSELEDIENEISDLEAAKIQVSWLKEHLEKLGEIAEFKDKSMDLKKTKARSSFVIKAADKELKQRHTELVFAQERFNEAEKRVNAMRLVIRKLEDDIMEYESEEYFWKRRLDDLI